ncbi:hypothetical protein HK099_001737 [Clydaea vesicula]|uniref:C2H2-type domain-containing protein n=1 Tax=Clydaea vesicula TaxID=447962 RepID=A0AAD5Y141_9FUNG|nr:hypothetical protein HK099_001737 [Clydaea vesicula]
MNKLMFLVKGQHVRWDVINQGLKNNFKPIIMENFMENLYPGYEVKRNKYGRSFKNTSTIKNHQNDMSSLVFRFDWFESEQCDFSEVTQQIISYVKEEKKILDATSNNTRNLADKSKLPVEQVFICDICQRPLSSERGLKNHIHMAHVLKKFGEDWAFYRPKNVECPNCSKMFKSKEDCWQHVVNRHTVLEKDELTIVDGILNEDILANGTESEVKTEKTTQTNNRSDSEYDYIPCHICGQAVVKREWGMSLHLETLKPAVGLQMECPLCKDSSFIESRALFQHYKFCRLKTKANAI